LNAVDTELILKFIYLFYFYYYYFPPHSTLPQYASACEMALFLYVLTIYVKTARLNISLIKYHV